MSTSGQPYTYMLSGLLINLQINYTPYNMFNDNEKDIYNKSNIIKKISLYWTNNILGVFSNIKINNENLINSHTWLYIKDIRKIFNESNELFQYNSILIDKSNNKFKLIYKDQIRKDKSIINFTISYKYQNFDDKDILITNNNDNNSPSISNDENKIDYYLLENNNYTKIIVGSNKTKKLYVNDIILIKTPFGSIKFINKTGCWIQNKKTLIYNDINKFKGIYSTKSSNFVVYDKKLWGVGSNSIGQLGLGKNIININSIRQIPLNINVSEVNCSSNHVFIKSDKNKIFVTGYNKFGQLGLSDLINRYKFEYLDINDVINIKLSQNSSIIQINDNTIYGCGYNRNEVFGFSSETDDIKKAAKAERTLQEDLG